MLSKYFGKEKVYLLLFVGFCFFSLGLSFSKIALSISTMFLSLITLLEWNRKKYLTYFLNNKPFIILVLFIVLNFSNLFWTENINYFWKDINIKMSFYAIPFVFIFNPDFPKKYLDIILKVFLFGLLISSLINFIHYFYYTDKIDFREMSLFLSHIRFGIMLCIGILVSIYLIKIEKTFFKLFYFILIIWFICYIYFSEVFSTYISLFILLIIFLIYFLFKHLNKKVFYFIIISSICLLTLTINFYYKKIQLIEKEFPIPNKNELTLKGNKYDFYEENKSLINGIPVYTYICKKELEEEWSKLSSKNLYGINKMGYNNFYILIQYMSSKGFLKKDSENFKKLTKEDIKNIENGQFNCCIEKSYGILGRIHDIKREWADSDPNGKTIKQRIEYLKASYNIFKDNYFFGVSSGDLDDSFKDYYINTNSKLKIENRLRTHNQFITYFVSFGIIGGTIFIIFFISLFKNFINKKNFLKFLILTIIILSFLSEDTLETQLGSCIIGFFIGLITNNKILTYED